MERRRHERYDVEAALCFCWKRAGNARHDVEGVARDISGGGVFIFTRDPPPVGSTVRFSIFFSSFLPSSRLVMEAVAQVVRLESPGEARPGFAAVLRAYKLRNEEEIVERQVS